MPLKLHRRGKVWHYRGTVAGRRIRGSCGTTDKEIAQRIASESEQAVWNRHFDGPGADLTMAQAFIAYADADKPTRFLARLNDHWRDTPVASITAGAIRASARKLYPDAATATWNRQVIVPTQAVINHAAELGWCLPVKVQRFKVNAKTKVPATAAWVSDFAEQANADRLPHLGALALFMFGTGARVGEATAIRWADVNLDAREAKVEQTKVASTRTAHLPAPVVAALANIPSNRNPAALVFQLAGTGSVSKVWRNIAERAGIANLTPHCCRHGFATAMLRSGYDVKTVAAMGGWKDAATVLRTYAHAITDRTITDAVFDTLMTQEGQSKPSTYGLERNIRK